MYLSITHKRVIVPICRNFASQQLSAMVYKPFDLLVHETAQVIALNDLHMTRQSEHETADALIAHEIGLKDPEAFTIGTKHLLRMGILVEHQVAGQQVKTKHDVPLFFPAEKEEVGVHLMMLGLVEPGNVHHLHLANTGDLEGLVLLARDLVGPYVGPVAKKAERLDGAVADGLRMGGGIVMEDDKLFVLNGLLQREGIDVILPAILHLLKPLDVIEPLKLTQQQTSHGVLPADGIEQAIEIERLIIGEADRRIDGVEDRRQGMDAIEPTLVHHIEPTTLELPDKIIGVASRRSHDLAQLLCRMAVAVKKREDYFQLFGKSVCGLGHDWCKIRVYGYGGPTSEECSGYGCSGKIGSP